MEEDRFLVEAQDCSGEVVCRAGDLRFEWLNFLQGKQ